MVQACSFLTLHQEAPDRWSAIVDRDVLVGHPARQTLYGGAGLGFAVQALERATGRPAIWTTAQFLAFAFADARLTIHTTIAKAGYQISQAEAVVTSGDETIARVSGAFGSRPRNMEKVWTAAPDVPPPDACPLIAYHWRRRMDDMNGRLDVRVARVDEASGRYALWARAADPALPVDASLLAVLGDFVPTALGGLIGPSQMSSLDNTLRYLGEPQGRWVLCDSHLLQIHAGLAHGSMLMHGEDGRLLAYASQSMIVRL